MDNKIDHKIVVLNRIIVSCFILVVVAVAFQAIGPVVLKAVVSALEYFEAAVADFSWAIGSILAFIGLFILLPLLGLSVYFFPSIVGWKKKHKDMLAIFILNFFLAWTGLGWVIALIWAVKKP